jgi:hypothetical protein
MTDAHSEVVYRKQFCQKGYVITGSLYAAEDADQVRFWDGEFCLIEVVKAQDGRWDVTGGDGDWAEISNQAFDTPDAAMAAYAEHDPRQPYREATDDDES